MLVVVLGGVLLGLLVFVAGVRLPGMMAAADDQKEPESRSLGVRLVAGVAHTLEVPDEVRMVLGIRKGGKEDIHVVQGPTTRRPLVLSGSTALDPTRLMRIRARFAPAEVVRIFPPAGHPRRTETEQTGEPEELRPGDHVQKGDELAVFFSVDVGSKKNDLLDALVQLELDQKIMDRIEEHPEAVPEVFRLTQWRAVQTDRNAINRALNNLKVWNIPQEEIDALHVEAKNISADKNAWFRTPEGRWVKGEKQARCRLTDNTLALLRAAEVPAAVVAKLAPLKDEWAETREDFLKRVSSRLTKDELTRYQDRILDLAEKEAKTMEKATLPDRENDNPWGRVTLRAPDDGIMVERNIARHEIVQDPTTNLFQIARVDRLLVIANAPEDDLPILNALPASQRNWTVRTVGATVTTEVPGRIDEIGYLIDPNQHTAIIKGYINNPKDKNGQFLMRAGQFVSATLQIGPPADVVEVPTDCLVEDGKYCVVFVQTDAAHNHYTMRRVQVTHRFEQSAFVLRESKNFDIPFTGDTTKGDDKVLGVSADLTVGMTVTGPGIPPDTTISALESAGGARAITLSKKAVETAKGARLQADETLTTEEKEQGMLVRKRLVPNDRILKSGVGELKAALIDLEPSPSGDTATR
jgi:multidrug efflux pump subunit AcrA (membrane-fusion protein)